MNTQDFYKEFERQVDLIGLKELLEGFSLYLDKQASYYHKQAEKENKGIYQESWLREIEKVENLGVKVDDFLTTQCAQRYEGKVFRACFECLLLHSCIKYLFFYFVY